MATEKTIRTTTDHNGTDTTIVVVPFGTVIGFRIWTDVSGKTRCFHILTEAAGFEAETCIGSEYFSAAAWRSHAMGLAAR